MLVKTYNQDGQETGQTRLPKEIFGIKVNSDLLHQVVLVQMANRRRSVAQTKDRAQVRGGGKKPWRQKGTGRARHGSIRSPLWKGGGVTFGPTTERVFQRAISKKMRRKALLMALSAKANEQAIAVLEDLKFEKPQTKIVSGLFKKVFPESASVLVAFPGHDDRVVKSIRNIPGARVMKAGELNVLDLLSVKYLLLCKDSIKAIKDTFLKTNS